MGFYQQLQEELIRSRKSVLKGKQPRGRTASPSAPATNGTPSGGGATATASWSGRRRVPRGSRAFTTTSYRVPGLLAPIRQPTGMVCWATVTTMMYGWLRQQSIPIETVMGQIGQVYLDKYNANQGLKGSEKGPFLAAAGLQPEPPMSWSIDGWMQNLKLYGPLWVTTDEDPSANFAIHARIIVAMTTDGTPDGTSFQIVDPATATEYAEDLNAFLRKYEEEARTPGVPLRIQVVHFPAGTQPAGQASLGQSRAMRPAAFSASVGRSRAFDTPLAWGARVSQAFRDHVRTIASNLGCDPDHLMAAMAFETGETFSPSIRNAAGSGATGLIQFMPSTAQALGTTTTDLAAMSAEQQLAYVEKYFAPFKGKLATLEDVYMAILWPRAVGQPNSYVLFSRSGKPKTYQQNAGLDRDGDGNVTKQEAASVVAAKLAKGRQPANAG
jgi:hypothetical protein